MPADVVVFSIIVPVYNVEEYLEQCVNSVLNQSFSDFELILVDDGSPDQSGKMCDRFAALDHRVKVIHQENAGLSAARNSGIKVMKGQYVLFLDSDDYWIQNDFLTKLWKRIELMQPDVISFNYRKLFGIQFDSPYYSVDSMPKGVDDISFHAENGIWIACAWNKLVRAELFDSNNLMFVEGITAEDVDWCARLAAIARKFDYINIDGVAYRQREGSITRTPSPKTVSCLENNISEAERIAEGASEKAKQILYPYLSYQVGVLLFNVSSFAPPEQIRYKEKMKQHLSYLRYAQRGKMAVIYRLYRILGYRNILRLLAGFAKIRR